MTDVEYPMRFLVNVDLGYKASDGFDRDTINQIGEALSEAINALSFKVGFLTITVEETRFRVVGEPMPADLVREHLGMDNDLVPPEDEGYEEMGA